LYNERQRGVPVWAWGALVGILLIAISSRSHLLAPENPALSQHFAAQPTPVGAATGFTPPQLDIAGLPAELQATARDVLAAITGGKNTRPVEPAVESQRLRVEVRELQPAEGGLRVVGTVTNIGDAEVQVPISAFELRDSAGGSYVAGGGGSATLRPGDSTPLELTVPLPPGRGLLLVTSLSPDPAVEQRLIVAEQG
jgi:hypothetical protein